MNDHEYLLGYVVQVRFFHSHPLQRAPYEVRVLPIHRHHIGPIPHAEQSDFGFQNFVHVRR
jgi:hypothetical protein